MRSLESAIKKLDELKSELAHLEDFEKRDAEPNFFDSEFHIAKTGYWNNSCHKAGIRTGDRFNKMLFNSVVKGSLYKKTIKECKEQITSETIELKKQIQDELTI